MSRDADETRRSILAGLVTIVLVCIGAVVLMRRHEAPEFAVAQRPWARAPQPSLYCEFYDFTRARVVVSFDFAIDGMPVNLRFSERAEIEPDGTRTPFEGGSRPVWKYAIEEGTPVIASPIDETRIVLYGLQPAKAGVFWTEAGLRSNRYRNLEGKCRQANLVVAPGL